MGLEERIIKRWQKWWENKAFEPTEESMRQLIAIALEEFQEAKDKPKTPKEIIQYCRDRGISVAEFLGRPKLPKDEAIDAYLKGEITEGHLADCLGCDRLEARRIVQEFTDKELTGDEA